MLIDNLDQYYSTSGRCSVNGENDTPSQEGDDISQQPVSIINDDLNHITLDSDYSDHEEQLSLNSNEQIHRSEGKRFFRKRVSSTHTAIYNIHWLLSILDT